MKSYKDIINKNVLRYSFANRVFDNWNKITEKVVSANSINSFKTNLDEFLKAKKGVNDRVGLQINPCISMMMANYHHFGI